MAVPFARASSSVSWNCQRRFETDCSAREIARRIQGRMHFLSKLRSRAPSSASRSRRTIPAAKWMYFMDPVVLITSMLQCSSFLERRYTCLDNLRTNQESLAVVGMQVVNPDDLRAVRPLPEPEANIPIGHHLLSL